MAAGRQVVVLADHTKIGHDTMCQTVPSERIDVLVTDPGRDPAAIRRLTLDRRRRAVAALDVRPRRPVASAPRTLDRTLTRCD